MPDQVAVYYLHKGYSSQSRGKPMAFFVFNVSSMRYKCLRIRVKFVKLIINY